MGYSTPSSEDEDGSCLTLDSGVLDDDGFRVTLDSGVPDDDGFDVTLDSGDGSGVASG
jgi:hypothetical protein